MFKKEGRGKFGNEQCTGCNGCDGVSPMEVGRRKKIFWRARNPRYQALPGKAYLEALPHISLSRSQRGRAS